MKTYIKWIPLIVATFFISNADAAWKKNRPKKESKPVEESAQTGQAHEKEHMVSGYSAPARWNPSETWDYFLEGSFIYWNVSEEMLGIGNFSTDQPVVFVNDNEIGTLGQINIPFKYKPGFKLAAGMNFERDGWTGTIDWTRLHFTSRTETSRPPGTNSFLFIFDWWDTAFNDGTAVERLKTRWRFEFDTLDFELARPYYLGRMLVIRPFMGPRFLWIDQEYHPTLTELNTSLAYTVRWDSESWGVGPRMGFDLNWELGYGFRLTGDAGASILYRSFRTTGKVPATNTGANTNITARIKRRKYRVIKPNTEAGLGMAWGTYFWNQTFHFDIKASYDFHYFWDENVLRQATTQFDNTTDGKAGDLSLHGLTLTLRIDF